MVTVNNACRALFIFIAFTLMGCQSNVELPAQLVAVVDNYGSSVKCVDAYHAMHIVLM